MSVLVRQRVSHCAHRGASYDRPHGHGSSHSRGRGANAVNSRCLVLAIARVVVVVCCSLLARCCSCCCCSLDSQSLVPRTTCHADTRSCVCVRVSVSKAFFVLVSLVSISRVSLSLSVDTRWPTSATSLSRPSRRPAPQPTHGPRIIPTQSSRRTTISHGSSNTDNSILETFSSMSQCTSHCLEISRSLARWQPSSHTHTHTLSLSLSHLLLHNRSGDWVCSHVDLAIHGSGTESPSSSTLT